MGGGVHLRFVGPESTNAVDGGSDLSDNAPLSPQFIYSEICTHLPIDNMKFTQFVYI